MAVPPQLTMPATTVSWIDFQHNNAQRSSQYPSVFESAWRASDGSIGIVLTNIVPTGVTFSLPVTYARLRLLTGAAYTVQTTDGTTTATLDCCRAPEKSGAALDAKCEMQRGAWVRGI